MSGKMDKEKFEKLTPRQRGYAVYMVGARDDFPGVPDEDNPYPVGSPEHEQWNLGQQLACQDTQDSVE